MISRGFLGRVEYRSIEYSAVIQPPSPPCSLIHRGTLSSRVAAQITCVWPNRIKTEPWAWGATPGSITTSRRSEAPLPSRRSMKPGRLGPSLPWLQAFKNTQFASILKIDELIPISHPILCDLLGATTLSCARRFFLLRSSFCLRRLCLLAGARSLSRSARRSRTAFEPRRRDQLGKKDGRAGESTPIAPLPHRALPLG